MSHSFEVLLTRRCQVFINKAIFSDPMLKGAQLSFAAFHFFITFITLHIASLPQISMFERVTIRFRDLLPLGASMSCNVVLVNLSLAFSSVPFYQATRVLLTPAVAALNFILYQTTIPRQAAMTLIPTCSGIGLMTYFDVKPHASTASTPSSQTSILGAIFAFSALFSSSIYTVLISHYHSKLKLSSMQLLHQQALMSGVLLLYGIPFLDTLPQFSDISSAKWTLILLSGACASIINLSQFTIIAGAGPVASTVVGHSKTVLIVTIGWIASGKSAAGDKNSIVGIVIAIAGIVAYVDLLIHWRGTLSD